MHTLTLRVLDRTIRVDCEESDTTALLTERRCRWCGSPLHRGSRPHGGLLPYFDREGGELRTVPDDGSFLASFDKDVTIELQKLRHDLYSFMPPC